MLALELERSRPEGVCANRNPDPFCIGRLLGCLPFEAPSQVHNDLSKAEDVPEARGLRNRAIGHVDRAHEIVDNAERTAHWE